MVKQYKIRNNTWTRRTKLVITKILLFFLGRGFQTIAKIDPEVAKEINTWDDNFTIMFEILPDGPYMSLAKQNNQLKYLGFKKVDAHLTIGFKNLEAAFLIFTAQKSTPIGYAEHRLYVKGDLALAMSLIRCLNIVQFYLFPGFIAKKILKRMPSMSIKKFGIRLYTYLIGIPLGL
ncbi:MAG: hypothetical protein GX790_06750 [Syntrophomonadaceae bacterium]|nr:hypothetical protein [Syntrophomonadaceae bacterium]